MNNNTSVTAGREPFARIIQRPELHGRKLFLLRTAALALAITVGGIFIALMGRNPLEAYALIIKGACVGSVRNPFSSIEATVETAIPLLIVSLGLSFAFKMKFWNIGGEGQIIMGGIFASYFAINHSGLPHILLIALMLSAGALGGGLWGLIPTVFKVKFGTNETLFTLMLNYIALYMIRFLEAGPWQGTPGFESIAMFHENSWLNEVFGVHTGWIFALLLTAASAFYLSRTKHGYEISVVGESPATARYAGMNVNRIILRTMFISAAVCGTAGMVQVAGIDHTLSTGITGGTGFTGITVAWLAKLNPVAVAVVTALFSILEKGSSEMRTVLKLDASIADVLQGIILFVFLGCEFFIRYGIVFSKRRRSK